MKIKQCVVAISSEPKSWMALPSMLVATLLISAPLTSWAAVYEDDEDEGEADYSEVSLVTQRTNQFSNTVDIGLRYLTDDAFKFGEYNSQEDKGWQIDGNFDLEQRDFEDGSAKYFKAEANSIGTKSRDITLEGGQQGDHKFQISFDGIEKQTHGQFISNYDDTDPYNQVTPATGVAQSVSVYREKLGVLFSKKTQSKWNFTAGATNEHKTGSRDYGQGDNPRATLNLYPIDYTTRNVNLGAEYATKNYQVQVGYELSQFDNAGDQVNLGTAVQAQEPDNRFQQLHTNVNYRISTATRFNAFLAYSNSEQNEGIINPGAISSGSTNADAQVKNVIARVGVSSRVTNKLTLNAKYNYQDKDNKTTAIINNAPFGGNRTTPAFDTTWHTVKLDGYYRLPQSSKIGLGYEHEKIERPDQNREKTNEDKVWASYKLPMMGRLSGTIKLSMSDRDGSAYNPDAISMAVGTGRATAAGTQKYHDADREQTKGQVNLQYQLGRTGHVGLMLQQWNDEYDTAVYGLKELDGALYSIDFGASPMRELSYSLYAGVQSFEYDQSGIRRNNADQEWTTATEDENLLAGLNIEWEAVPNLVKIGLNYRYMNATAEYSQTYEFATPLDIPDVDIESHTIELTGEYFFDKQTTFIARAVYQDYVADNFAYWDAETNSFAEANNASIENPDHNAALIEMGVRYQF